MTTTPVPPAEWTIRWATLQDQGNLQSYIAKHWAAGHLLARDQDFLRWQFASPNAEQLQIIVAEQPAGIGGILGVIDADWVNHQRRGRGAWLSMWSVATEYRQFGLALRLLDFVKKQGYELVGTVGANPAALQLYRLLKYQILPVMPRSVRLFSYEQLVELLSYFPQVDVTAYKEFWKTRVRPLSEDVVEVNDISRFPQLLKRWDDCWEQLCGRGIFSIDRNAAYLQHRYFKHPYFKYQAFFSTSEHGLPTGICVYRLAKVEPSSQCMLRVVEYVALDDSAYAQLSSQLLAAANAAKCVYADFSCTLDASHRGLPDFTMEQPGDALLPKRLAPAEFGKTGTSACWQMVAKPADTPSVGSAVYLTSGDCDQDRPN